MQRREQVEAIWMVSCLQGFCTIVWWEASRESDARVDGHLAAEQTACQNGRTPARVVVLTSDSGGGREEDTYMRIVVVLALPRDAASVPLVRHTARAALARAGVATECAEEVEVALSEACTNAYRHSQGGESFEVVLNGPVGPRWARRVPDGRVQRPGGVRLDHRQRRMGAAEEAASLG